MKEKLLSHITSTLQQKLELLQRDLEDLRLELSDNTKSTAGDKHETSRAMTQLEMEKLGKQHQETQKMCLLLARLMNSEPSEIIKMGSLVRTDSFHFLLGLPLGKIDYNSETFLCISIQSPVGQLLLNKRKNDSIQLPNGIVTIKEVL